MNVQLKKIIEKIDARTERERAILFLVCVALVFLIGLKGLILPISKQQQLAETKQQQNLVKIQAATQELTVLQTNQSADIDAEVKHQIAEYKKQLSLVNGKLEQFEKSLVAPEKMDAFLESILKQNKSLRLVSLKSFPVENIMTEITAPKVDTASGASQTQASDVTQQLADKNEMGLFKHEVEIVLDGNYLDILSYMKNLEALPERLYWNKSHLRVIEYPKARLNLRVFTLSLEKKWLNM